MAWGTGEGCLYPEIVTPCTAQGGNCNVNQAGGEYVQSAAKSVQGSVGAQDRLVPGKDPAIPKEN